MTVVEVSSELRGGGTPVDIAGDTIEIPARMGLLEAVQANSLPPRSFEFKNADDSTVGTMAADPASSQRHYEIHRDDLLDILSAAVAGSAKIVFNRSIARLQDAPDGLTVTFDDGSQHDYAMAFGRSEQAPLPTISRS